MDIKIQSKGKKAITSGTFVTIDSEENELAFKYQGEDFKFKLSFMKDDSGKQRLDYSPNQEKDTLLMKFYNFNNALGTGLVNPIEIAESGGKKIFMHMVIHAINENVKQVSYTFYIDN